MKKVIGKMIKRQLLVLLVLLIFSCKEKSTEHIDSIIQPEPDELYALFKSMESDQSAWWQYHQNNILLSSDFIAFNEQSEKVDKDFFIKQLMTGDFIALRLESEDDIETYKLYKLDESADKTISLVIKNITAVNHRYYNMEGEDFPEFSFTDLNGTIYNNQNIKGKTVILKCWFINCAPCIAEFPELNKLVEGYKDRDDVIFISLALDSESALENFLIKKPFGYAVIADQKEFISKNLNIQGYPTHFVIDENGVIQKVVSKSNEMIMFFEDGKITKKQSEKRAPPPSPH